MDILNKIFINALLGIVILLSYPIIGITIGLIALFLSLFGINAGAIIALLAVVGAGFWIWFLVYIKRNASYKFDGEIFLGTEINMNFARWSIYLFAILLCFIPSEILGLEKSYGLKWVIVGYIILCGLCAGDFEEVERKILKTVFMIIVLPLVIFYWITRFPSKNS